MYFSFSFEKYFEWESLVNFVILVEKEYFPESPERMVDELMEEVGD